MMVPLEKKTFSIARPALQMAGLINAKSRPWKMKESRRDVR
jgi:hypothetical protein